MCGRFVRLPCPLCPWGCRQTRLDSCLSVEPRVAGGPALTKHSAASKTETRTTTRAMPERMLNESIEPRAEMAWRWRKERLRARGGERTRTGSRERGDRAAAGARRRRDHTRHVSITVATGGHGHIDTERSLGPRGPLSRAPIRTLAQVAIRTHVHRSRLSRLDRIHARLAQTHNSAEQHRNHTLVERFDAQRSQLVQPSAAGTYVQRETRDSLAPTDAEGSAGAQP